MALSVPTLSEIISELEAKNGVSREVIVLALKEALTKGYLKSLGGDTHDVDVRCEIDDVNGVIDMCEVRKVVEEVNDDYLEISVEDANEGQKEKRYQAGDDYIIPVDITTLRKAIALVVKSVFRQKFSEAEKQVIFEQYKDKINTMITGLVERSDERGLIVNIGKTSVSLSRKDLIGDERFQVGEQIKLYVSGVNSGEGKGAKIDVSRSCEGFLRRLFEEEITDVQNETVEIKAIARRAGDRSKVAVYSKDPNVDPAGACIGPNGGRIQRVVSQLGNGSVKEKIDIVVYSDIPEIYVCESIKPAKALGVKVNDQLSDDGRKSVTVVVSDDSLSLAIGRRGINVSLASRLTGMAIQIIDESTAAEQGVQYMTIAEVEHIALQEKAKATLKTAPVSQSESLPGFMTPSDYVSPTERVYEEEVSELDEALTEQVELEEVETVVAPVETKEEVVAPVEEVKPAPVETPVSAKVTTTLADLEESLSKPETKKDGYKKKWNKKKTTEEEEEETVTKPVDTSSYMSIYTEEELREMEEEDYEDEIEDDDDVDYDEYDKYYDDDDR